MLSRLFLLISLVFIPLVSLSQHVTKEELLKLFYQAHSAQSKNDVDAAIDVYKKILTLSPGLPEPYLQLGNIYSSKTGDVSSLQKACICYANYLKLNPEATDAEALRTKISEMTVTIQGQNRQTVVTTTEPINVLPLPDIHKEMAAENYTLSDSKPKEIEVTVKVDSIAPVDSVMNQNDIRYILDEGILLGRWASASLGSKGREIWLLDFNKHNENILVSLNDSSQIKQTEYILQNYPLENIPITLSNDELTFTYSHTLRNDEQKAKNRTGFRNVIDDFLNVKLKFDIFSDNDSGTPHKDTVNLASNAADKVESVQVHSYTFRLSFDGKKLTGSIINRIIQKDTIETILSENVNTCEFFKAPDDYKGFIYTSLTTDEEKASRPEFRDLLNRKLQESVESTSAVNDLGCMYASGIGVRRNIKMAVAYFMEASMKRNLFGLLNMAQLYVDGLGVERDLQKARDMYAQAFEQGYSDAMVMCGDTYLTEEDYTSALDCYLKAVYRRSPYAYYRLGWLYKEGLGIEKDLQKALEYYQKAVDMQYPAALADLGLMYKEGNLVEKDSEKALQFLTKAADKGNAVAMYELYQIFLRGDGVKQDFKFAKDWYHKSMAVDDEVIGGFSTVKSQVKAILSTKNK